MTSDKKKKNLYRLWTERIQFSRYHFEWKFYICYLKTNRFIGQPNIIIFTIVKRKMFWNTIWKYIQGQHKRVFTYLNKLTKHIFLLHKKHYLQKKTLFLKLLFNS